MHLVLFGGTGSDSYNGVVSIGSMELDAGFVVWDRLMIVWVGSFSGVLSVTYYCSPLLH